MTAAFVRDISVSPNPNAVSAVSTPPDALRYVARQPILDRHGHVHGYELLFRRGPKSEVFDGDGDSATRTVLDNTIIFGAERLTGGLPMFVNCTREALLGRFVEVLPPANTVLELLETLEPDSELIDACRVLKRRGYRIALDDFEYTPAWQPLLALADYIKVDYSLTNAPQRTALMALARETQKQRPPGTRAIQLILERVETQEQFAQARGEGFQLFQGFYFCRPELMENRDVPANRLVHLQILQATAQVPLNVKQIAALIKRAPSLTYRLLRMVNSPIYATRQVVCSIQSALVMIGDEMFRRVVMLAATYELKGNRPSELLRMAFLRGRFCELAAGLTGQDPTEQYLLGMLSLLPAMLNVTMESVAKALPLRREVYEALLGEHNAEQHVLHWLMSYELGQWDDCDRIAAESGISAATLTGFYGEALFWAETNLKLAIE